MRGEGRIVHVNIPSRDLEESRQFYGALFGWEFTPNAEHYVLFSDRGGIGGGLTTRASPTKEGVLLFIAVADIPETLERVRRAGGSVELEKTPVGGPGFYAVFIDPHGNRIGIYSDA
ncbi:MAG: VOC family protein [Candidatus Eisenbacteria bacterium]|nr:VOC family protein [Candidatus Latescibacterota bacterium]MBD3301985.1 VOC family protein [Candidatus Eisenbacteria bacterium]